jgi:hypothetical protein
VNSFWRVTGIFCKVRDKAGRTALENRTQHRFRTTTKRNWSASVQEQERNRKKGGKEKLETLQRRVSSFIKPSAVAGHSQLHHPRWQAVSVSVSCASFYSVSEPHDDGGQASPATPAFGLRKDRPGRYISSLSERIDSVVTAMATAGNSMFKHNGTQPPLKHAVISILSDIVRNGRHWEAWR